VLAPAGPLAVVPALEPEPSRGGCPPLATLELLAPWLPPCELELPGRLAPEPPSPRRLEPREAPLEEATPRRLPVTTAGAAVP